jgi:hypothetical protein
MAIARENFEYSEPEKKPDTPISGWRKVSITEITEPKSTKNGNATGFFIRLDVWDNGNIQERETWLSFDHSNEFVVRKSNNIGHMLRMMFPAVIDDCDYVGQSFWLNFRLYDNEKTGKKGENFFDFKRNVSLDGRKNLDGVEISEGIPAAEQKATARKPVASSSSGSDDDPPPF